MKAWLLACVLGLMSAYSAAATQISPDDPTQYIRYWSDQIIAPENNSDARWAHDIYSRLLRAWDYTRVAPNLNIIRVKRGTWAASLADGNILITESALALIKSVQPENADHLLAFVIAHEFAHQRSDDLWHLKFYRMVGDQSPEQQSRVLGNLIQSDFAEIEKAEAQADQDAIVLMATVGYNPHAVLDAGATGKDFYTTWVEQIWDNGCESSNNTQLKIACAQAQLRALRTRAQIESIAEQSVLYDLGVQAMVAGNYEQARRYFTVYGRSFPNRAVLTSIGLTYFAEAFEAYREQTATSGGWPLYFPVFIDAQPLASFQQSAKRGISLDVRQKLNMSLEYFNQAKKLAPNYRATYLLMISAYQMMNNQPMALGLLEGEYVAQFGRDAASDYLSAINQALQGKTDAALSALQSLEFEQVTSDIPNDQLAFASVMNQTALLMSDGREDEAKQRWLAYAQSTQQSKTDLFQVALTQLQPARAAKQRVSVPTAFMSFKVGDKWLNDRPTETTELWYDGAPYQLIQLDGRTIVLDDASRVVSVRVRGNVSDQLNQLETGWTLDRVVTNYGAPKRRLDLMNGQYLAYDHLGLAVQVEQNRVVGWFYYLPR